ncbi:hypothetical protein NEF87_002070 [Candidatus Lokiarchaeum ossiferum]|uniref:Uncharacterized protein n=1 Tax=Candidatus Lokiarchaeum ossiferum TaxID=2951803 RepID=A0ABY6HQW4_9ARCH|nr:hypothetical protein NEF87_002070 [Candidatus Lokiarchaeum sp. B-35]
MTHYLMKIVENPKPKDPVKDAPDVHKHFTRYSKGMFDGPVFKVSQTKTKISIWCSYEYEDVATKIALKLIPEDEIMVKGNIIGAMDFKPLIEKIGFSKAWYPVKSKGKAVNYSAINKTNVPVAKEMLVALEEKGTPYVYNLLSFASKDKTVDLKTKMKPPRPSSKNPDETSPGGKIKFCTLKIPNTPENLDLVLDMVAKDFKDEIPPKWKSITISNSYEITDLEFPPKDKNLNSRLFRLHTLRKGKLNRIAEIDKNSVTNTIEFTA